MSEATSTKKPQWDKKKQTQWAKLVGAGHWGSALELAEDSLFSSADFTRRLPSRRGAGPWGEHVWFSQCKDAQTLERLLSRVEANPSVDAAGKPRPFLTPKALTAALSSSNDAGLAALRQRAPKLFSNKKAIEEGVKFLLASDEWVRAENAPVLRKRLEWAQAQFPGFVDAKKIISSWADPREFFTAAHALSVNADGTPGRAAIARLALGEAGLDPWAHATLAAGDHPPARLALMALNCETPDLFLEFVRAGVDPDRLVLETGPKSGRVVWPQGILGSPWVDFSWTEAFDLNAKPSATGAPVPLGNGPRPILMFSRHQPEMRPGVSARALIETAIESKPPLSAMTVARASERFDMNHRQNVWRSMWEAHVLRETLAQARSDEIQNAPNAAADETPATRRAARL